MSLHRAVIFLLMATLEPGNAQIGLVNLTLITFCFIASDFANIHGGAYVKQKHFVRVEFFNFQKLFCADCSFQNMRFQCKLG